MSDETQVLLLDFDKEVRLGRRLDTKSILAHLSTVQESGIGLQGGRTSPTASPALDLDASAVGITVSDFDYRDRKIYGTVRPTGPQGTLAQDLLMVRLFRPLYVGLSIGHPGAPSSIVQITRWDFMVPDEFVNLSMLRQSTNVVRMRRRLMQAMAEELEQTVEGRLALVHLEDSARLLRGLGVADDTAENDHWNYRIFKDDKGDLSLRVDFEKVKAALGKMHSHQLHYDVPDFE